MGGGPFKGRLGSVEFTAKIQRYLGVQPVKVLDQYEKASRAAYLTCVRCGAFVSAEHQMLHNNWHAAHGG